MMQVVGISELCVSDCAAELLATYSLGSCIGLTLFDPLVRVGGMVHCMLPDSSLDPQKALASPAMFVDTGVRSLIEAMCAKGAHVCRLVACAAGAAAPSDSQGHFNIGKRNRQAVLAVLATSGVTVHAEDTGGAIARNLYLHMQTGRSYVRINQTMVALA